MPMTSPCDILGVCCHQCGKLATHWYGAIALCCQCHKGEVLSPEETRAMHLEEAEKLKGRLSELETENTRTKTRLLILLRDAGLEGLKTCSKCQADYRSPGCSFECPYCRIDELLDKIDMLDRAEHHRQAWAEKDI